MATPNVGIRGLVSDTQGQELSLRDTSRTVLRIDGGAIRGANLFHSFPEFNRALAEGRSDCRTARYVSLTFSAWF
ncbi:hypothetical protein [Scytonema hofmannii]|uniref:hypothetical protein n=1 Tax=Scytonema hofmannii TaxID=34078 RepID=UPI0011DF86FE|nr:hypothetical protein [Scytonema hofmannii]